MRPAMTWAPKPVDQAGSLRGVGVDMWCSVSELFVQGMVQHW